MSDRVSRRARSPPRRGRLDRRSTERPSRSSSNSRALTDLELHANDQTRVAPAARKELKIHASLTPMTLDSKIPIAQGIGATTHVIMSARAMRTMEVASGHWVQIRSYGAFGGSASQAGRRLSGKGKGRKGQGGRVMNVANVNDDDDGYEVRIVEDSDVMTTVASTAKSNARQNLTLDIDEEDGASDDDNDVRVGARVVLARAWPSATLGDDAVSLSKKVWLSLGAPPGGTALGVEKADTPLDGFDGDACSVSLRLWTMETDVGGEAAVWLDRGLRDCEGRGGSRRRAMLEGLAKRALDGRGLLVGNLVRLPLLGTSALFEVINIVPDLADRRGLEITSRTRVELLTRQANSRTPESSSGEGSDSDVEDIAKSAVKRASRAAMSDDASFDALGGVRDHEAALRELVALPLQSPEVFTRCGVKPPRGVLLHGPPGSGKTRLARAAAHASNAKLFVVNGPELVSANMGQSEEALRGVFLAAVKAAPSVVLLDELDAIAPARDQSNGTDGMMSSRIVATMLSIFDGASATFPELDRVVVIATTNRPEAVERSLRRPGRFDRELEVGVPTPSDRLEILRTHLRGIDHELDEGYVEDLARRAHGFVGADIAALCQTAAMRALTRVIESPESSDADISSIARALQDITLVTNSASRAKVTVDDFEDARVKVRPSALREVAIEIPNVRWDDVGGLEEVKNRLKEAVEWAEKHPEAMKRVGATPPKGILLYGPPGCSKTMLARAVANASGRNFISIKGSELFSKWVGDSEKAVRSVFARARSSQPCVIFIDEVDGLAGTRGGGEQGGAPSVQDRVITQLLGEMDGLAPTVNVTIVAATNRPDLVDSALLRPGRFDRLLYVPPPSSIEDRLSILQVLFKNTPLAQDVDLKMIAASTQGYTGADLSAIVREAALAALEENIDSTEVNAKHLGTGMMRVRPSPPARQELVDMYEKFQRT